jgi:hypothetical protein
VVKTRCPAVTVPEVTPCDPAELAPLVDFHRGEARGEMISAPARFTVLPGGAGSIDRVSARSSLAW